jgi:hypothetical protein
MASKTQHSSASVALTHSTQKAGGGRDGDEAPTAASLPTAASSRRDAHDPVPPERANIVFLDVSFGDVQGDASTAGKNALLFLQTNNQDASISRLLPHFFPSSFHSFSFIL